MRKVNFGKLNFVSVLSFLPILTGCKFARCEYYICYPRVDENYIVKVADFGLSRDVADESYYTESTLERPKPYKWMALESIMTQKYSEKTDVVSVHALAGNAYRRNIAFNFIIIIFYPTCFGTHNGNISSLLNASSSIFTAVFYGFLIGCICVCGFSGRLVF